jgi:hypothetical protein
MAVEQVSVNILRILGLEATDEVDMKSYKGFLREKLVEIDRGVDGLSREEQIAVREEFQRVRGSTATKVKKTTINPQAVFNRQLGAGGGGLVKYKPPASGSLARRVIPQQKTEDGGILDKIYSTIASIRDSLLQEENRRKKAERNKKLKKDKEDKAAKESSLEKAAKGIVGALEKTFKPVVDIFKKIRDALMLLFLGWVANRLLDWIKDPKNLKTFNAIVDFLSRNAGKLLLLFVMLNNPLVKVVRWLGRNMISFLVRMISDLVKGKGLLNSLRFGKTGGPLRTAARVLTSPEVAVPAAIAGMGVLANEVTGQRKAAAVQAENKARAQSGQGLGVQGVGGVGDMGPTTPYGMLQGTGTMGSTNLNSGGMVKSPFGMLGISEYDGGGGVVRGPSGIDQVPANLTEGEVVFSKPAVKTFGEDFLLSMNKFGGGTNRPTYSGGRMYAAGGGLVNPVPSQNIARNRGGYAADTGLDILTPVGSRVVSPVSGILEYAERGHVAQMGQDANPNMPGMQDQHSVRIKLDKPFEYSGKKVNFFYVTHMYDLASSIKNKSGLRINAGDFLGLSGVANQTPHVHVGFVEDRAQNSFLDYKQVRNLLSGASVKDLGGDTEHGDVATQEQETVKSMTFATEKDRRLISAYLNYITQPMGRGLDILPTIDQVTGVPGSTGPGASPSSTVPSGSATPGNPQATVAAANRQIASPTR